MALNTAITRFGGGVTSAAPGSILENLKEPNPSLYHRMFSDFATINAAVAAAQIAGGSAVVKMKPGA